MIRQLMKLFGLGTNSTFKTVSKSFKSIDKLLEAEHITGTIDKAKEFTGDVVEKAGQMYEQSKMKVEELIEDKSYEPVGSTIDKIKDNVSQMGDAVANKLDDISEVINEYIEDEEE